jgi:polyphosphate kinase 2 (PPK2 family)
MDLESRRRWERYTKAKEEMLERTHIPEAPWWIVEGVPSIPAGSVPRE